eukprot:6374734-Amphidinium_carterae.1
MAPMTIHKEEVKTPPQASWSANTSSIAYFQLGMPCLLADHARKAERDQVSRACSAPPDKVQLHHGLANRVFKNPQNDHKRTGTRDC